MKHNINPESVNSRAGFTIVELLLVIIVIAILASISVVAYGGISRRAQNSQVGTAVANWEKILLSYKQIKGDYYYVASGCMPLLGRSASEFTDTGGCTATYNAALIADIQSVTGFTIPPGRLPDFGTGLANVQGVRYIGTAAPVSLQYNYSGNGCAKTSDTIVMYNSTYNISRCERQLS